MAFPIAGQAAILTKANNTTNLNLSGSWTTTPVFDGTEIATWDSTVTSANTTALGGSISLEGINIVNPTGAVTINATTGAILSLGSSGISSARSLTIKANIALTADQTWSHAAGTTLTLGSNSLASPMTIDLGSNTLTITNPGVGGNSQLANFSIGTDITGSGSLVVNGNSDFIGTGNSYFVAVNSTSYTGSTTILGGRLLLRTNATLAGSSQLTINGGLLSFNSSTSVNSGVPISIYGGYSQLASGSGLTMSESPSGILLEMNTGTNATVGDTTLRSGAATIAWDNANAHGLVFNTLTRDSSLGGVLIFGSNTTRYNTYLNTGSGQTVTVTTGAPTPIGGTTPGQTDMGVVPWAMNYSNSTPITYESGTFRSLTASEYTTSVSSGVNVRFTSAPSALTSNVSVNSLGMARNGGGTLDFAGHTLGVTSGLVYSMDGSAGVGGTFALGNNASSTTDILDFGSQEGIFYGNINANAKITGTGGITLGNVSNVQGGAGLTLLNANNTFTGGVRVEKGKVRTVTNSEVIDDTNSVFVAKYGTFEVGTSLKETVASLSGVGTAQVLSGASMILGSTIGSPTANAIILNTGGVLAPGNESGGSDVLPGVLTLATASSTGSILLQGGAVNLSLNSATAYDSLSLLANAVDLTGGPTLNVSLAYAPTVGDGFLIVANDGADAINGFFSNGSWVQGSFGGNDYFFNILYNTSLYGGTGNDIALVASAVPEPSTIALLGLAVLGGIAFRFRRHQKSQKSTQA